MKYLLSLDLSTTCTGFSVFSLEDKSLVTHGFIKPKVKGVTKLKYPEQQLEKMKSLAEQILELIESYKPHQIVIEEIAGSKQRLGQKTLDGLHWIVCYYLQGKFPLSKLFFYDVTGTDGWRTHLRLKMSDADKHHNKEAVKLNKKLTRGQQIPKITPKHLACRYVNKTFGTDFNVDLNATDNDVCDSIAMGSAYLKFKLTKS